MVALLFFAGGFSSAFGGLHSLPVGTRGMVAFSWPRSTQPCFFAAPSPACGAHGSHAPTTLGARLASSALSLLPLFPGLASVASVLHFPLWISSDRHHLASPPLLVLFWPEFPWAFSWPMLSFRLFGLASLFKACLVLIVCFSAVLFLLLLSRS